MSSLGRSFESLSALGGRLEELLARQAAAARSNMPADAAGLQEVQKFGDNPGNLRMLLHVPEALPPAPGLVVALHGCGQTAGEYALCAGWSKLAERCGFILLCPEQHASNNPKSCFSWFNPLDTRRGLGEVHSIQSMVGHAIAVHGIDRRKVFVTGLSAGGAMASALLACYPDVYAGGSIIAGLPHGCAGNVQEALEVMFSDVARVAPEVLVDRVRIASRHDGPWPRVSVWHGTADPIVKPVNGEQIARQWVGVHGLGEPETVALGVHSCRVWRDRSGAPAVEFYSVVGMGHGVPLQLADVDSVGAGGPFFLDVGLCSSRRSAVAWGLADASVLSGEVVATDAPARFERVAGFQSASAMDPVAVIDAALKSAGVGIGDGRIAGGKLSPGKVIEDALRVAGLKK